MNHLDRINQPALSVRNLTLRYGDKLVLDDLSLELPAGAVVGLVGRNGAGKSSLLRCMLSLSLPQQGQVDVLGDSANALSDATRARLGYVPQSPALVEWMSVWQHISYIGSFYPDWSEVRARALCIRFELPPDLKVKSLSVGDRQKLSIILALAHDPELVLMDEPVAGLDPLMRREFMRAIFDTGKPRTMLISSHLLSDLERIVSHVIFMRSGRVQLIGGWDELVECLRLVVVPQALAPQPGLVTQRATGSDWLVVIDKRRLLQQTGIGDGVAPTLADLFVELNS
jgi:ABC-2 type transport system ATP-binding protein